MGIAGQRGISFHPIHFLSNGLGWALELPGETPNQVAGA